MICISIKLIMSKKLKIFALHSSSKKTSYGEEKYTFMYNSPLVHELLMSDCNLTIDGPPLMTYIDRTINKQGLKQILS